MSKKIQRNNVHYKKHVSNIRLNSDTEKCIWDFTKIDKDGQFAFDINRKGFPHKEILDKLISYNNMTWAEIKRQTHDNRKSKHHFLSVDTLSTEALKRIKQKQLEEYHDAIFSFALQGKMRIVGIRNNQTFFVVWYDGEHKFCPSHKKHT